LKTIGPNRIAEKNQTSVLIELWQRFLNPLNLLLLVLAGVSWALSDLRSALVIVIMVVLSVGLGFIQEHRSSAAAAKLAQMVSVKASVRRPGANGSIRQALLTFRSKRWFRATWCNSPPVT
jgi:Mg2+-importing ATPase